MTELAYLQFRKEIDSMFYPEYRDDTIVIKEYDIQDGVIGLMIVDDGYIDCLWVKDKYRGKGLGYRIVKQYIDQYELPKTLRILHNNEKAKEFWNKVFYLREFESNPYDCLYGICGEKVRESNNVCS